MGNAHTMEIAQSREGVPTGKTTFTVSVDGKLMTTAVNLAPNTSREPPVTVFLGNNSRASGNRDAAINSYCSAYAAGTAFGLRSEIRSRMKLLGVRPESACVVGIR